MLVSALPISPLHHLGATDHEPLDLPRRDQLRLGLRGGETIGREDFVLRTQVQVEFPFMLLRYRGRLGRLLASKFPQERATEDHLILLVDVH